MNLRLKRTIVRIISYSAAAVAVMAGLMYQANMRAEQIKADGENLANMVYQRAFAELVSSVEDINHSLEKSVYATSPSLSVGVFSELFSESREAAACLGMLPFKSAELEKTSAFVSRVGDYCYTLAKKMAAGQKLTEEEAESLRSLSQSAAGLASQLVELQSRVLNDGLKIDAMAVNESVEKSGAEKNADGNTIQTIENDFQESPSLIYDGPFSEHIEAMEPKFLEGKEEVSKEEAQEKAEVFFDMKKGVLKHEGEVGGKIPAYVFTGKDEAGDIYIQVTKAGGEILYMSRTAEPKSAGLTREGAMARAKQFLDENGVSEMKDTYTQQFENTLIINYAYQLGDVMCYSDLVKVTVALDTGNIIGYEARGYIMSHAKRDVPQATITPDQAMQSISGDLKVLSTQYCIIPSPGKNEVYCIELKCENAEGKHYLVYVNAQTGVEEKLLILLEDENGTLSV